MFLRLGSTVCVAQQGLYEQRVLWEEDITFKYGNSSGYRFTL